MMRKRVGLLVGLLALALGSGVVAQEPSPEPPPWFGGRVEMPEYGFALDLAAGWVAFDLAGDEAAQTERALPVLYPTALEEGAEALARLWDTWQGSVPLVVLSPLGEVDECSVVVPAEELELDLDSLAAAAYAQVSTTDEVAHVEQPEALELSSGPARRLEYRWIDERTGTWYFGIGADAWFMMTCTGPEASRDDWLSIAETFEFLPAEE